MINDGTERAEKRISVSFEGVFEIFKIPSASALALFSERLDTAKVRGKLRPTRCDLNEQNRFTR